MAAASNNALIGALRVEASIDAGKFVSGAAKIRKETKQTEATIKSSFTGMGAAMKAGIAGFVGTLTVGYFTNIIKAALDYAGSLGEVAQQLGVTTRDLQTFRFMAGQVGVSQEQLETGLSKLTITLGKVAAGAKEPAKALNAIGISAKQVANTDTGTAFRMIADGLAKVDDRAQRAAIEVALFGKTGSKLDNMLAGGSQRINELSAAAERLGIVLSDEQIRKADDTADKLEALKTVLSAQIAGIVADNADAIYKLADSIAQLVSQIPNAIAKLKSFYAQFLNFSANVTQRIDQAIEHPLNRFNPLTMGMRGGQMHANRVANIQADRAQAQAIFSELGQARFGALFRGSRRTRSTGSIPQFLGGGGGSRRHGPEDQSAEALAQMQRQQLQADADILRAKQQLATSSVVRAQIELQLIEIERQMQAAEIDEQVRRAQKDAADGRITKAALAEVEAQAAILKEKNDQVARLKAQAVIDERTRQVEEDTFDATMQSKQFAIDNLKFADQMAETRAEHRRIQLQILEAELEQKRLELEHQKQLAIRNGATQREIDAIQAKIDHIAVEQAQGTASIVANTRGPLEDYLASLPTTADKANEALQRLEVDGFEGLIDAALELSNGFKSAAHALLQTLRNFFLGLARLELQKGLGSLLQQPGVMNFLQSGIGGIFGSGGIGGGPMSVSSIGSTSMFTSVSMESAMSALPKFAYGGGLTLLGRLGDDQNVISMNGWPIARADYGERLTFTPANDRGGRHSSRGNGWYGDMYVMTPDADSFRRSEGQVTRGLRRRLSVR